MFFCTRVADAVAGTALGVFVSNGLPWMDEKAVEIGQLWSQ